jgi:hypothetical protein
MPARIIATVIALTAFLSPATSALGQVADSTPTTPDDPAHRIARDLPTWTDTARHYHLVLSYDGKRIRLLRGALSQGSARSYLSQRQDVVVNVRGRNGAVLRRFNLPDPLQLRVWDSPGTVRTRFRPVPGRSRSRLHERTIELKSVRFELSLPQVPGALRVEFRKSSAKGRLLGAIKLATIR